MVMKNQIGDSAKSIVQDCVERAFKKSDENGNFPFVLFTKNYHFIPIRFRERNLLVL